MDQPKLELRDLDDFGTFGRYKEIPVNQMNAAMKKRMTSR